jgi:hypothetical protein
MGNRDGSLLGKVWHNWLNRCWMAIVANVAEFKCLAFTIHSTSVKPSHSFQCASEFMMYSFRAL